MSEIGIEDNFFSLGGDSILSIRVVALLKSRGIALGINDIFQHQTIALLAAQAGAVESEAVALEPFALLSDSEREEWSESYVYADAYPMSTLQAGMVFHTQLEQFNGVYHDIVVEHVKCVWEEGSFAQALTACVEEHPVLRTVFRLDGERPLQLVQRAAELPLEVVDLRGQADAEQYVAGLGRGAQAACVRLGAGAAVAVEHLPAHGRELSVCTELPSRSAGRLEPGGADDGAVQPLPAVAAGSGAGAGRDRLDVPGVHRAGAAGAGG